MRPVAALGLALLVPIVACGKSDSITLPTRTVISHGGFQLSDPMTAVTQGSVCDIFGFVPLTTPAQGTLDVTVDWTFGSNDLDVFLEGGECNCASAQAGGCRDLASAQGTTAKPEKLTVPNLAAGRYTLVIANAGPGRESASYEIGLTR